MSIVSLQYLAFVVFVCGVYLGAPKRAQKYVLLIASYFYFWTVSEKLIIFLLMSTFSIYISGIFMSSIDDDIKVKCEGKEKKEKKEIKARGNKKKLYILLGSLAINLGILLVLKYANFFSRTFNSILSTEIPQFSFLLPLGISYYTLQAISYSIDVYRGSCKATRDFAKVALYLSFFPHIMEGPFGRFSKVGEQLVLEHRFEYSRVKFGAQLMLWGYFKKMVVADRAAQYVNEAFNMSAEYSGPILILGVILYTIQIYAEFSGCIDIMTGISQVMGITLGQNFRQPFFAKSVQEFWQRWHITLGTWFKEYIFFPVSCSKLCVRLTTFANKVFCRHLASLVPAALAMFCVWFTNGFWHGASWKYIFYGLYYYGIMMLGMLFSPLFNEILKRCQVKTEMFGYQFFQMMRTTLLVLGGMLVFRAESLKSAFYLFRRVFSLAHIDMVANGEIFSLGINYFGEWIVLGIGVLTMLVVDILHEQGMHLRERLSEQPLLFRWMLYYVALFAIIIFGVYGMGYDAQAFIYAGF